MPNATREDPLGAGSDTSSPPVAGSGGAGESQRVPAIEVVDLTKIYYPSPAWMKVLLKSAISEPVTALDNASFTLHQGKVCVVVGPNGAGKSTLFRILTGLTVPTSGTAKILGHNVETNSRLTRSFIGYMPAEDRNLMLRHTAAQNLEFRGKLQGIAPNDLSARVTETLEQVGIIEARNRAATSMSTGMKARLQLAAAILHKPKVLILDEPTSTVDPIGAHELLQVIEDLTRTLGLSVILSSHRLEEIDALEDNVIFLDQGRIIHNGSLNELRTLWEDEAHYRVEFSPGLDLTSIAATVEAVSGFEVQVTSPYLEVKTDGSVGEFVTALGSASREIISIDRVATPLRSLFHKLVTGQADAS